MGQGSPKLCESKSSDSIGLLELSQRKVYSKPKRDLASKSQMITWQKQWCNMEKVSADPQRDNERRTDEGGRKTGEIKQEKNK